MNLPAIPAGLGPRAPKNFCTEGMAECAICERTFFCGRLLRFLPGSRPPVPTSVAPPLEFSVRPNAIGIFDVVCMRCFTIVGTTSNEADISAHESSHVCDPSVLVDVIYIVGPAEERQR
jgi:hypothetical protein